MIQVRRNVFETNSSSTHSLVMAVKSEFDKWREGELYYCNGFWTNDPAYKDKFKEGNFYPKADVDAYYEAIGRERDSYRFPTYDEFCEDDELEVESYNYVTPNGEEICAIAKYGYNG